jgi:lipopolysaccharide export system permease protein
MTILDRYIAKHYLINAAMLLVILACFVVTIDVSLNLNRYWETAVDMSRQGEHEGGGLRAMLLTIHLIADLWWPRLLQLFTYLSGVVIVGAMGFTVSQLVRQRELIAVLMSGQSLVRVARPIIASALLVQGLSLANQEFIIANEHVAKLLTRDAGDAGRRDLGSVQINLTRDGSGRVFFAKAFDADKGELQDLIVWERDESGRVTARTQAEKAIWRDGAGGGAWMLTGGTRETLGTSVPPTPIDTLATDLDPVLLRVRQYEGYGQKLSSAQIGQMIARLEKVSGDADQARQTRHALERIRWGRWSMLVSNMLALLISTTFFLTREPKNMLVQSLKCAPISILALIGGVIGSSADLPGLPAWLSALLPVGVLGPIAIALFTGLPRRS